MKVYSCPDELPAPEPDYRNPDWTAHEKAEEAHAERLADWLRARGYTGPMTGKQYSTPRADGFARYMYADAPRKACLIHLPYGDAWHDPDVAFLPKAEVLRRIVLQDKRAAFFAART
jgi:hypothetical protein